ncbi:ABC transporter ATP-binding protein [Tsukamurella sp. 8F]|uniref:ABC transporter ATP-binding protein n=1 Tax=unclassified Tsukamurella TaxID=2633480 RepID=UPI0023B8CD3F|nr:MULTISPECIES: ABC transporter ATP-binding protein [unclassified Tsukamurella]MDF0532394.1 ABC transporter ATP-binding protein [Tsukamurella sp. 8J]MDF0588620.1 ABC transporter ATP-binding protein [Tsukamurella sp. 8F]
MAEAIEATAKERKAARAALEEVRAPVEGSIRLGCVIGAVGALAGLAPFVGLVGVIHELLEEPLDRGALMAWCVFIVICLVAKAVLSFVALGITHFADVRLQAILRRRIVAHLGRVPLGWFGEQSSGRVRKAAMGDVHDLHQMVAHHAVEMTAAITMPIGGLAYLLFLDWRLALLALASLPLYVALYAWMMRGFSEQMRRMDDGNARISAAVAEFVSGIAVVKTFGQARQAHQAYRSAAEDFVSFFSAWARPMLRLESVAGMAISAPVVGLLTTAGVAWFVDQGWVEVSEGLACVLVALVLPSTIQPLVYAAQNRRTAEAAAVRIHDLLGTPELAVAANPGIPSGHRVEFDGVRFTYDGVTDVLHAVTLTCAPGTVTALVGPSGSGKSTLAALLLRFHDVSGGAIRIGGVPVDEVDPVGLYHRVGFVLQDVQLLHASVRDNVRLGRPDAHDDDIERACVAARIHDRILALPRAYDSVIGEDALLSGGEAQRVSIARALLADAPVLVLDEATAFADPESESAIQDALSELAQGRTVLVIAHRLRTIAGVDLIAVLDRGQAVETGRHDELLAAGGLYARMWAAREGEDR